MCIITRWFAGLEIVHQFTEVVFRLHHTVA